jgi:hypothetical protein
MHAVLSSVYINILVRKLPALSSLTGTTKYLVFCLLPSIYTAFLHRACTYYTAAIHGLLTHALSKPPNNNDICHLRNCHSCNWFVRNGCRYIRAFNFAHPTIASCTITDIYPTSFNETIFASAVILLGCAVSGAVLGAARSMMSSLENRHAETAAAADALHLHMHRYVYRLLDTIVSAGG